MKTSRLPPYRMGKGIRKEYATIDRDESKQLQPIVRIVMIAIAPIIVAQDAHEETSDMRRLQRYNQLYILGAGLKRERPDSMQEWQEW